MLDDYKQACREAANFIEGWEKLSKNELCRNCVSNKHNKEVFDAYFSALLYRYWNLIPKFYLQSSNVASPEDCYDWLVTAITYAIDHTRWDDEDSTVYNDPNGPDKVINRCMKSVRLTFYQFINRKKRKENFGTLSLDELTENVNNTFEVKDDSLETNDFLDLKSLVIDFFRKKDYFVSYMIDCIINEAVFESASSGTIKFNEKKLAKFMRNIDENYCKKFSHTYDIPLEDVLKTLKYFNGKSSTLNRKIEENLLKLKHNPFIESWREVYTC